MTRRRVAETAFRSRRFKTLAISLLALAGCATLPQDHPVFEQLDADTGVTIVRLGKPVELYREAVPNAYADRFAFLAPFETNQMGKRETFLWLAVPIDPALKATAPTLDVDGISVPLGDTGSGPDYAGLARSPYKVPTPWSVTYYFRADAALLARLGAAQRLAIHMTEPAKNGTVDAVFELALADDPRLREFAARQ